MKGYNENNYFKDLLKKKGFYISLMAAALCVVAFAAVYLNSSFSSEESRELKINDTNEYAELNDNRVTSRVTEYGIEEETATIPPVKDYAEDEPGEDNVDEDSREKKNKDNEIAASAGESDKKTGKKTEAKKQKNSKKKQNSNVAVMKSGKGVENMKFDQEKGIMWPVSGSVLMKYSPDRTIYYKTLGVYKTNPALIISSQQGANVCSAADAVVTDIGENEEIGKYVETAIGDGYKVMYGQLDNIQVEKGAELKEGEIVGTVAEPSRYYSAEGANLYMKMTSGDESVDPLIFLR